MSHKSQMIRGIFEGLAPRYDTFNLFSSLGLVRAWYGRLFQEACARPRHRLLDLCTGTGELALGLRASVAGAFVVGADFSPSMLDRAAEKARRRNAAEVSWVQARAEELPFHDSAFDLVTMGFAMRNMESSLKTLQEIRRVLDAGGEVFILELGRPHNVLLRQMHRFWLATYVKAVGLFLRRAKDPFIYLAQSIYEFFDPSEFRKLLLKAGFASPRYVALNNGIAGVYIAQKPHS